MSTPAEVTRAGTGPSLGLAASRRRRRLLGSDRFAVWLCGDVGLQVGPPGRTSRLHDLESFLELGFDTVVLSLAGIERFASTLTGRPDLRVIARIDWTNQWRALSPVQESAGVTVGSAARAAALGADGIIHYALLGHTDPRLEADYIGRAAQSVQDAHAVGLPCVLEPLIRGGGASGRERDPAHQRWAVRTVAELGADAVKIEAPTDPAAVLRASDVPILIASTPPVGDEEAVERARTAAVAGGAGVAYAADIFGSADPATLVRRLTVIER